MSSPSVESFMKQAVSAAQGGRMREAISMLQKVLAQDPSNAEALARLGIAYLEAGHGQAAEKSLRKLLSLQPDYSNGWKALGSALGGQLRFHDAGDAFMKAHRLQPDDLKALTGAAQMFLRARRYSEAVKAYQDVLNTDENNLPALMGLGHACRALGDDEGAIAAYREVTVLEPRFGQAWWSIANLKTSKFADADCAAMTRAEKTLPDGEAKAAVQFALAKAYEDEGETDAAFDQYLKANETARAFTPYDARNDEAYVERIEKAFSAPLTGSMAAGGYDGQGPVFIIGMPRSGSTLIEQILASHSMVEGLGELPSLGLCSAQLGADREMFPEAIATTSKGELKALGRKYFELTAPYRSGAPFFVDKMPNNFFLTGLIARILPKAAIIDARRHPMDSCVSSFRQFFAKGQVFSYGLEDMARYYRLYDRLMKHWDRVLPGRVLRVDYEAMVIDQESETRRLLDHCGLPFEAQCLKFHETRRAVSSASSEQVRKPLYRSGLQSWRRYESRVSSLQAALGDIIEEAPDIVKRASA